VRTIWLDIWTGHPDAVSRPPLVTDSYEHDWVKCGKTVTLDRWGSKLVGKNQTIWQGADGKAQQRKTELGHSRMGQSPCPGSTDLYPLLVSMEIIGPGWLELKQKCWIAWGLAEPWVVKRSNWVLHKLGPKLRHLSLQTESDNHSTSDQKYYNATQDDSIKQ